MRVAIVSPYDLDVAGGVQSHVVALARALRAGGDQVVIVGPGSDGEGRVGVGGSVRVPANGSRAPIALAPMVVPRVRSALRGLRPDVVHVHEPLVPLVGPAASLGAVAPVVLTFHAYAERGSLAGLARAARPLGRRIVGAASALTAVSAVAAGFHARALGIDPAELRVIPNGVDVTRFAGGGRGASEPMSARGGPTMLFVGRLERRKGVDVALRAFGLLAAERPDLRLRLVGDGPEAGEVTRLIAGMPDAIRGRVVRSGRVSNADLPGVLGDADVLVVPSRGGESFGIVLLEAMATGTALIAADLDGYRAVARHGREALLVPPGDPVALAVATARVLDEPSLRTGLVDAGRARAAHFDWSAVAAKTRDVYVEAIAGEGSPAV
jgi:phosphatidylinositol alpha-mannosyltransferase